MSDRVKPSKSFREQFPRAQRGHGTAIRRSGEIVIVQWDGGPKEELHVDHVEFHEGLGFKEGRRPRKDAKEAREQIVRKRKEIRAAFDKIRDDPFQKDLANELAGCLGGSRDMTGALWREVRSLSRQQ